MGLSICTTTQVWVLLHRCVSRNVSEQCVSVAVSAQVHSVDVFVQVTSMGVSAPLCKCEHICQSDVQRNVPRYTLTCPICLRLIFFPQGVTAIKIWQTNPLVCPLLLSLYGDSPVLSPPNLLLGAMTVQDILRRNPIPFCDFTLQKFRVSAK